jgi:hypothetical protein
MHSESEVNIVKKFKIEILLLFLKIRIEKKIRGEM